MRAQKNYGRRLMGDEFPDVRKLHGEGMTGPDIAAKLCLTVPQVHYRAKLMGLTFQKGRPHLSRKLPPDVLTDYRALRAAKVSRAEACKVLGVNV